MDVLFHSATSPNVPSSVLTGVAASDVEVNELDDAQSDPCDEKKTSNHICPALKHVPRVIALLLCQKSEYEICTVRMFAEGETEELLSLYRSLVKDCQLESVVFMMRQLDHENRYDVLMK